MLQPGVPASPDESGVCKLMIMCKEIKSLYLLFVPDLYFQNVSVFMFFFFLRLWMTLACQAWTELTAWQSIWWSCGTSSLLASPTSRSETFIVLLLSLCDLSYIFTLAYVFDFSHGLLCSLSA